MWSATQSDAFALAPGESTEIVLTLEIPNYAHTRLLVFIVHEGFAIDKSVSRWFDDDPDAEPG